MKRKHFLLSSKSQWLTYEDAHHEIEGYAGQENIDFQIHRSDRSSGRIGFCCVSCKNEIQNIKEWPDGQPKPEPWNIEVSNTKKSKHYKSELFRVDKFVSLHFKDKCTSCPKKDSIVSSKWVARECINFIKDCKTIVARDLISHVNSIYSIAITPKVARTAIAKAQDMLYGTVKDSYTVTYLHMKELLEYNAGSIMQFEVATVTRYLDKEYPNGIKTFDRLFISFAGVVKGTFYSYYHGDA